jgi:polysaccharide export outer membrane protein
MIDRRSHILPSLKDGAAETDRPLLARPSGALANAAPCSLTMPPAVDCALETIPIKRNARWAKARTGRALGLTLWAACTQFLSGCSDLLPASSSVFEERLPGTERSVAARDGAELARAARQYVAASTPGEVGYKIGPQDVLDITVFKAPELSKTVQVAEAGTINLPLVGDVGAAGTTAAGLERELEAKLGAKYLKSPQVTIYVKEFNSQRVTVEGAVKKPCVYPIRGHDTLLGSIAMAEGLDRDTASSNVVVFSTASGVRTATRYDIDNIRNGNSRDPPIHGGDVIVVDDSVAKAAFQTFIKMLPLAYPLAFLL